MTKHVVLSSAENPACHSLSAILPHTTVVPHATIVQRATIVPNTAVTAALLQCPGASCVTGSCFPGLTCPYLALGDSVHVPDSHIGGGAPAPAL